MKKVKFKELVMQKISTSFLFENLENETYENAPNSSIFMNVGSDFYNANKIEKKMFYKPISKLI